MVDTPLTGNLECGKVNTTGSFPYAGYHTVVLSRMVPVVTGKKFAVVVKFTTPGYTSPVPVETKIDGFDSAAHANSGQSFVSSNGSTWGDLINQYPNANVDIRAYTAQNSDTTSSDCLFNWAERTYPQYFSPAGATSQIYTQYYFRYYPGTGNYIATSSNDNDLWLLGPGSGNGFTDIGPVTNFLTTAGCSK